MASISKNLVRLGFSPVFLRPDCWVYRGWIFQPWVARRTANGTWYGGMVVKKNGTTYDIYHQQSHRDMEGSFEHLAHTGVLSVDLIKTIKNDWKSAYKN